MKPIKEVKLIQDLNLRLKKYEEIAIGITSMKRKINLVASKMYRTSKKIVYGIENELHLIE